MVPSDFDVKHNFNLFGLYELPIFRKRRLSGTLLGGFQVSGILTFHSGFPFTPVVARSGNTLGKRSDFWTVSSDRIFRWRGK